MSDIEDPRDNPSQRVQEILRRTGTVSPWDFAQMTGQAINHAADPIRQDAVNASLHWRPLGPRNLGGRIRCLAQDERDPQVIFAGSGQGGVWRTKDAGDSWTALDSFSPPNTRQSLAIGAIAVSYSNPEIVYVGTGEPTRDSSGGDRDIPGDGLFKSSNGGDTFHQIDDVLLGTLGFGQYENIVIDPWDPDRVWIASPDGGLGRITPPPRGGVAPAFHTDVLSHPSIGLLVDQRATDIMVDFGPSRTTPPNRVWVYVALFNTGIYRAQYDRSTDTYVSVGGNIWTQITPRFPRNFTRIKIAYCRSQPNWIGAVAGIAGDRASRVFISDDRGDNWITTRRRTRDGGTQARYDLVLEFHPQDPTIFIYGSVELFRASYNVPRDRTTWTKIIDWTRHDRGDRAQHADQHALLFDAANPTRIWVANDGGVSTSPDLGGRWRERGLGINAAQFYDITTHPKFPYIYAGGLQDNGTWLSYGGSTWFHVNGADGGAVAFHPTDPRRFVATWQSGLDQTLLTSTTDSYGSRDYMNRLPDVAQRGSSNVNLRAVLSPLTRGFSSRHTPLFVGVVASNPQSANDILVGRTGAVYRSTDGVRFRRPPGVPRFTNRNDEVSNVAFSPQTPTSVWITTDNGQVFFTPDVNTGPWNEVTPPTLAAADAIVTGISFNPQNESIVAISATVRARTSGAAQSLIYLSGDSGQNWSEISGRTVALLSSANEQFSPSAATAIVIDPSSPADVTQAQIVYCACFAGIYVIRNAIAPTSSTSTFTPVWHTFNNNLPLPLIFDLEAVTFKDNSGTTKHLLRCATHARGSYECDLSGAPRVKLLIRDNIVDDGVRYDAVHLQPNNYDPRLTPNPALTPDPAAIIPFDKSIDIRIDTPPYRFFGSIIDGLEMDEQLRSDELAAGIRNIIYVQLHNYGYGISNSAELHLFWARSGAIAPNLQNTFWSEFPNVSDGDTWQKVESMNLDFLESGQPKVLTFNWDVPGDLTGPIALLAVATDPINDALDTSLLSKVVDPSSPTSFIGIERRTALFITDVVTSPADVSSRDGFDDTGIFNETAWGTQSYDIIVTQVAEATPNAVFTDLNDPRESDVLHGSGTNHIYVRVHNQGGTALTNPSVEVFRVNLASINDPSASSWQSLGTQTEVSIPANSSVVFQSITWANPPDPTPASHYILVAFIQGDGDPRPEHLSRVDSIESFWQLLLEDLDSGNAAVRRINWQA